MSARWRYSVLLLCGGLLAPVGFSGCGNSCGTGTMEVNGTCVAQENLTCGLGTKLSGGKCVPSLSPPDAGPPDGDVLPDQVQPDQVFPDGPPPNGCKDDATICKTGTRCNRDANTCEIIPGMTTQVTGIVDRDYLKGSGDPAFSLENGKLMMYYILIGGPAGSGLPDRLAIQTDGRAHQQIALSSAIVEIDPDTLERVGDPRELLEFNCPTDTISISKDALYATWTCNRECYGYAPVGAPDICTASRASVDDPWGNFRVATEISTDNLLERDPTWVYDADGNITGILWVVNPQDNPVGITNGQICYSDFDVNADAQCVIDPVNGTTGPCKGKPVNAPTAANGTPACERYYGPGSTVVVSDPFSALTCPEWRVDARYLVFGRSGLGTQGYDIFMVGSSKRDGVVDEYLGGLSGVNTASNELGVTIAPPPYGNIIAWNSGDDIAFFRDTVIRMGKVDVPAE